jgi:putative DNA primase/helicase
LRSFSAIALSGELAIEWRILPWCKGSAAKATLDIFEHWRQAQPLSATSREHAQILERILDFISEHGSSRFSDHEGESRVVNRAGYWKDERNSRIYLFTAKVKEATKGFDFKRVIRALDDTGAFFKVGTNQRALTTRIPGENRTQSLYWINPEKLTT